MSTHETRIKIAEFISFGFTMTEAIEALKLARDTAHRKTHKVAESFAASEERTGIERLSYGDMKWGKR